MGMSYIQIDVSRDLARSELLACLKEHVPNMRLPEPADRAINTAQDWYDRTTTAGMPVDAIAKEVLERLVSSGKAVRTEVSVNDSSIMSAHSAYQPLRAKMLIVEEIAELIRMGVLFPVQFNPEKPRLNYNFELGFGGHAVMVTEYGVRYLAESSTIPYYAEDYLSQLRQAAEPDEELVGYLSEGLACLRHHLPRAAVMILRLAAEHSLSRLIESTTASLSEGKERQAFERRIRRAGIRIEQRAEALFRKLESSPETKQWRNAVRNRLRPSFHAIRDLGGRAAHAGDTITGKDASDHYVLFTDSVYGIIMRIIEHQKRASESPEASEE